MRSGVYYSYRLVSSWVYSPYCLRSSEVYSPYRFRSSGVYSTYLFLHSTGEFTKSVWEVLSLLFFTLYKLSIYPSVHEQLRRHRWDYISRTLFVNSPVFQGFRGGSYLLGRRTGLIEAHRWATVLYIRNGKQLWNGMYFKFALQIGLWGRNKMWRYFTHELFLSTKGPALRGYDA